MNSDVTDDTPRKMQMLLHERRCWNRGRMKVAGVDEAGRGPLAGPVVAAAVIFPRNFFIAEVDDSKQLTRAQREVLYDQIMNEALGVGVGMVDNNTIDNINILNATFKAMHAAVHQLSILPDHLLVDGNRFAGHGIPFTTIVDGDALSFSIAAASIIAKVTRDRMMVEFDIKFPGYGFAKHKGYGTREHRQAITRLGLSPIHRRSFKMNTVMGSFTSSDAVCL
jgi:ribonuclease HII